MILVHKTIYIVLSYLLGSVLFSELSMRLFHRKSLMAVSDNHNPGASNAFKCGGIACGILAVSGDVGKGFVAVYIYNNIFGSNDPGIAAVMAAVALGHAFSVFYRFNGGMCIAVAFGAILGLWPTYYPVLILALLYITFLAGIKHSNSYITEMVFALFSVICCLLCVVKLINPCELCGIIFLSVLVCIRIWNDINDAEQKLLRRFFRKDP